MNDYPSEAHLERIADWPWEDLDGWFAFIRSLWWGAAWGWDTKPGEDHYSHTRFTAHLVSTGGWSGNEEIIDAMERNTLLWELTWYSHRVGGHYEFRVPILRKEEKKP